MADKEEQEELGEQDFTELYSLARLFNSERFFVYSSFPMALLFITSFIAFYTIQVNNLEGGVIFTYMYSTLFVSFLYLGIFAYVLKKYIENDKILSKAVVEESYLIGLTPLVIIALFIIIFIFETGFSRLGLLYLIFTLLFYTNVSISVLSYLHYVRLTDD